MQAYQTLTFAANALENGKWIQGNLFKDDGMCMLGAVRTVANIWNDDKMYWDAMLALREKGYTTKFNDAEGRTKEEVVAAMRMVSDLLFAEQYDLQMVEA